MAVAYGLHTSTSGLSRDEILAECWERASKLARRYAGALRHTSSDDLAQDAMVRCIQQLDQAIAAGEPVGYLYRVIHGAMVDALRRDHLVKGGRVAGIEAVLSLDMPNGDEATLADLLADEGAGQVGRSWAALYEAVSRLSPGERSAIARRFGLDVVIDAQASHSILTERSLLCRALKALRNDAALGSAYSRC